uniref:Solute carrier family 24 member 3 n=1 Tax=Myripristis murdjan TaxID=586833 RepID=A0A667XHS3_9TELE
FGFTLTAWKICRVILFSFLRVTHFSSPSSSLLNAEAGSEIQQQAFVDLYHQASRGQGSYCWSRCAGLDLLTIRLHLSEDVAGATFMAAGSSAPELFTSVIGVFITKGDVGVGTIVGSAVFNILCIIGVCGFFAGVMVRSDIFYSSLDYYQMLIHINHCTVFTDFVCVGSRWESLVLILMYPSVLMVDELLSAYPHQLSFSEAGMRIMITSHFSPRTRLTMASRMLINEVNTPWRMHAGTYSTFGVLGMLSQGMESGNETENENEDNENNENDEEGEAGVCNKLKWLSMWPLCLLLFFTVPNCAKRRWEKWFMVSFLIATIWIAALSYIMVWMVTVIGFTLGIPDVIMGITFLAAGTSVPDCMASLIVARQGLGDMAISNSIGSNVFDILVGLGLPWALQTLCIDYGSNIHLNSRGLIFSVGLLLASVFLTVIGVHLNKWVLDRRLGLACLLMYAVFLCFSILIEFNVFIFVNLPMCRDIH